MGGFTHPNVLPAASDNGLYRRSESELQPACRPVSNRLASSARILTCDVPSRFIGNFFENSRRSFRCDLTHHYHRARKIGLLAARAAHGGQTASALAAEELAAAADVFLAQVDCRLVVFGFAPGTGRVEFHCLYSLQTLANIDKFMIEVENLRKEYGEFVAVDGVSFRIEAACSWDSVIRYRTQAACSWDSLYWSVYA